MSKYLFYYDETEHSRVINQSTIQAKGFYDGFVTVVVGWKEDDQPLLESKYSKFENTYRQNAKELKSSAINNNQLKYGFASLSNKTTLRLVEDLLGFFDEHVLLQYTTISKTEYIVNQLLRCYRGSDIVNIVFMSYSVAKIINVYQPAEVIEALYKTPDELLRALRSYCKQRIRIDYGNALLKQREINTLRQLLCVLKEVTPPESFDWDYSQALYGFKSYLAEQQIDQYSLSIDREMKTAEAARSIGMINVAEIDSRECWGVRTADMLAGLIVKLLKAIRNELRYSNEEDEIKKQLLNERWFELDNRHLRLYHELHRILVEDNNCWYKAYGSVYSDDLVFLISLLNYFTNFNDQDQLKEHKGMHAEHFNYCACRDLQANYDIIATEQIARR